MSFNLSLSLGLALALAAPAPLSAQAVVQPLPGTTDADRLGEQMRALAINANDVDALITAGEFSLKLGDLSAAALLFARAEKIDPRNARLRAGEGSVLVRSERPGEALRYFAQAQSMGLDPARFAGDRGLAYDLVGEQERAQRDYRLALRGAANEEVTRRYALSLGISGKRDLALEQLDPLLRDTDRGAWRARAFVLAMAGDVPGAERIATTMMPPGMAAGLQPFFQRLPRLPAIDRAFAVHFGEVRPTPERLADARLAPPMPALGPDPYAPVQVARAALVPFPEQQDKRRKNKKDSRQKPARVELAAAAIPVPTALPPPPAYSGQPIAIYEPVPRPSAPLSATARANAQQLATIRADMASALPAPIRSSSMSRGGRAVAPAVRVTNATPVQTTVLAPAPSRKPTAAPTRVVQLPPTRNIQTASPAPGFSSTAIAEPVMTSAPVRVAGIPVSSPRSAPAMSLAATSTPTPTVPVPQAPATTKFAPSIAAGSAPAPTLAPTTTEMPLTTSVPPGTVAATTPIVAPTVGTPATQIATTQTPASAPVVAATARVFATSEPAVTMPLAAVARAEPALPVTTARDGADTILARIIAGLSIPSSELGISAVRASTPPEINVVAEAKAKEARDAAAEKLLADKAATDKTAADKKVADRKVADRKKAAFDKKALAAKKIADDKKAAEAKIAADAKKAARANPARIWVQVSGGANEGDLPKAYAAVKAKAPAAFAGKSGWSTPLRATNRVLAGPFKTDAEARSFVNQLAKAGVSAFTFASDEGQQVTRLPAK